MQMPQDEFNRLHRELATAMIVFHEAGGAAPRHDCGRAQMRRASLPSWARPHRSSSQKRPGLSTGAITGIVDRLERAGYARRKPNPKDRRSVLIRARKTSSGSPERDPADLRLADGGDDKARRSLFARTACAHPQTSRGHDRDPPRADGETGNIVPDLIRGAPALSALQSRTGGFRAKPGMTATHPENPWASAAASSACRTSANRRFSMP